MLDRRSLIGLGMGSLAASALHPLVAAVAADRGLDLALVNVSVWTGRAGAPRATALGFVGNRIAAIGDAAVRARITRATRVIDGRGGFAVPAFTDGHTHFLHGVVTLGRPIFCHRMIAPISSPGSARRRRHGRANGFWVEHGTNSGWAGSCRRMTGSMP